jgi:hypothetical protein
VARRNVPIVVLSLILSALETAETERSDTVDEVTNATAQAPLQTVRLRSNDVTRMNATRVVVLGRTKRRL